METTAQASRRRRRTALVVGASLAGAAGLSGVVGILPARGDTPPPGDPIVTTTTVPPPTTSTTLPPPPGQAPGSSPSGTTNTAPPPPTYTTVLAPPTTTGGSGTGGSTGGAGGGGSTSSNPTSATSPGTVGAGGVVWSDAPGTTPSASNPLVVAVSPPAGGSVTITKTSTPSTPTGYSILGLGAQITAPAASAAQPLTLTFSVATSALPAGDSGGDVVVFRDGVAVQPCATPSATSAQPDPCVSVVTETPGTATFTVLSSHASTWVLATPLAPRLAGADREGTAIAVSQATWATGSAKAVVLARSDAYPDALAGAPLAVAQGGPLLLTSPAALDVPVAQEVTRVLAPGGTVYLLGGQSALSDRVALQLAQDGYQVTRLAGADRFATAAAIANAVPGPQAVLETTGLNFPDALAAATAAPKLHGVVLLTSGAAPSAATQSWISAHSSLPRYAIGGPAMQADPQATALAGFDRYATAALVAQTLFPGAKEAGLASGLNFPDALAAGARLGRVGAPLLLTDPSALSSAAAGFISASHTGRVEVFGGTAAVSGAVLQQVQGALSPGG